MAQDLLDKKWLLMDIEYVQLAKHRDFRQGNNSRCHQCKRKLAIITYNKHKVVYEAYPCVKERELTAKEYSHFSFARRIIHKLDFEPKFRFKQCKYMTRVVQRLIRDYDIEILTYKGGLVEKDFAIDLGIESINLEDLGVKKVQSYDPLTEIRDHLRQLKEIAESSER